MSDFLSICIIVVHTTKESWSALAYFFRLHHNGLWIQRILVCYILFTHNVTLLTLLASCLISE